MTKPQHNSKFLKPYRSADRIIISDIEDYIRTGKIISALPQEFDELRKRAGFANDLYIALSVQKIGAILYTEDTDTTHFKIIQSILPQLKVDYLSAS